MREIGQLRWAAVQDWMCEDVVLERTGLDIAAHQLRTVISYFTLRELAPDVPWLPVLQGQVSDDYLRHADMYAGAGVDLDALPLVGIGTVCRRQHTMVAVRLIQSVSNLGLRLHGFGLKITSLLRLRGQLASADSMAWSLDGRLPQGARCSSTRSHKNCSSCLVYAMLWRKRLLIRLEQPMLWDYGCAGVGACLP